MANATTKGRRRSKRLPQNVDAHRGRFRAAVTVNGKRFKSHAVATVEEAAALAVKLKEASEVSQHGEPLTLTSSMDLLRREQAARGSRQGSRDFVEEKFKTLCKAWPASTTLHRIGGAQIERYMEIRREKVSAQTVHHEVALLARLFRIGKRRHLLLRSPFDDGAVRLPKVRNRRFDYLTREQVESLLARIRAIGEKEPGWTWEADVVEFLFLTGLRRAELARLRVEDLDPFKGTFIVHGKNEDTGRPLSDRAKAVAGRLIRGADPEGFVIPARNATERARADTVTHLVGRWKKRLGLKLHGAAHVLRHSFGTALVTAPGVSFAVAQRAMRHATPAMTMRYFHESGPDMRAAFEAVANGPAPSKQEQEKQATKSENTAAV